MEVKEVIDQSPKIVQQILQKVLSGGEGTVNLNIFIIYNNDSQLIGNGHNGGNGVCKPHDAMQGNRFACGTEKYHVTEEVIRKALIESNWSQSGAAKILQIPRYIVRARCERWNIKP